MNVELEAGREQDALVAGVAYAHGRVVDATGGPGAGVTGPFAGDGLRHRCNLHFAERQALVVKTESRVQLHARTVTALDEHRHIQLRLGEPEQAGRDPVERVAVKAAEQDIRAAGPQFGVAIKEAGQVVVVVAGRLF